jgi:hypothetical protein
MVQMKPLDVGEMISPKKKIIACIDYYLLLQDRDYPRQKLTSSLEKK